MPVFGHAETPMFIEQNHIFPLPLSRETFACIFAEWQTAAAMAGHIRERFGWNVVVPQYQESVELS